MIPQLYVFAGPNGAGKSSFALFTPLMQMEKGQIVEQATSQPDWVKRFLATGFQN